ncbi:hypothetical protein PV326_005033 [Microctonus aethiopoides]|nr:hypothetical protein PV326_005033 [Microctonus aethiopoides]
MTSMIEPMDVDSSFQDDGEDEVDTHSNIFGDDENSSYSSTLFIPENRYENKGGTFTTGIDIFSKDEQQKMIERAKRFGLKNEENSPMLVQEHDLYTSMGIDDDNESNKYVRFNVLHMRGTENMSTKDVFEYFGTYAPSSIEWINDVSCNIVWLDKISAARALLGLSKKIVGLGEKNEKHLTKKLDENNSEGENNSPNDSSIDIEKNNQSGNDNGETKDNTISVNDIDFPLPPGVWRKGIDCSKSKTIILRFATNSDKKQQHSEKLSDYYKKYGNPNFGGMKGILTDSRKRMYKQTRSNKKRQISETDNINNSKRMKNPWGTLSETWGANDSVENDFVRRTRPNDNRNDVIPERGSIKDRLGMKNPSKEVVINDDSECEESSDSDSDSEWNKRSKVLRMRMHADDEEEKVQKKRLKQLTKKIQKEMSSAPDLRSRLGRSKPQIYHDPIQVIVTNTPERYRNTKQEIIEENDEGDEVDEIVTRTFEIEEEEKEEGEWEEEDTSNVQDVTVDEVTDQQQDQQIDDEDQGEEEESSNDSSSDISEKEIQGPQGSVIKVIPRVKPRVASTVWARLNQNAQNRDSSKSDRRDLRETLKGDLRYRLGHHNRERSPLRIEVKNDKYSQNNSESE